MVINLIYFIGFDMGGEDLIPCNNVTRDHISYCCDHIANCCDSGDGRFDVLPYPTSIIATWNSASSEFHVLSGTSSTSSSSSSILPTSTSSPTTTAAFSTTSSATATPATSSSTTPNSSENDSGLSKDAQIGIGVGVAGGVVLAALLAYLFWRVHKTHSAVKQRQDSNLQPHPPSTITTGNGLSQSYAQSYQYKSPSLSPATPAQPRANSELSSEVRTYELPTNSS
ncbi:hypothetical protein F5Y07DRAFT_362077 [Xylaria sp. FL0933]|nr:hypothetical protein F5Y07DRAFT_362077 [Xylaria sp. FL0933]